MSRTITRKIAFKHLFTHPLRLVTILVLSMIALGLLGTAFSAGQYQETSDSVSALLHRMAAVFFYIGIGLTLFCSLLLYQFISFLIEGRRQEIGILRAMGASKRYVKVLFLSESLTLAMLQGVTGILSSACMIPITNKILSDKLGVELTFVQFSPTLIPLILGVSILVSILSTIIPIERIANKSPAESMKIQEVPYV